MKKHMKLAHILVAISLVAFLGGAHAQQTPLANLAGSLQNLSHSLSNLARGPGSAGGLSNQASSVPWNPRIEFSDDSAGRDATSFNQALPIIKSTLSILSCIPYARGMEMQEESGWRALLPYMVDHGNVRLNGELYGTPMAHMQYHDQRLCLTISSIDVSMPALNAIVANVLYSGSDSGETTSYRYTYVKTFNGDWRLTHYEQSN